MKYAVLEYEKEDFHKDQDAYQLMLQTAFNMERKQWLSSFLIS